MSQAVAGKSIFTPMKIMHIVIGFAIMLLLPHLGSPEFVVSSTPALIEMGFPEVDGGVLVSFTDVGMQVICLFLGTIYLWTVVDTIWPCFIAPFLLGVSDFGTMEQVLNMLMGNPMVVMIFFLLGWGGVLIKSQISIYLARFLMTLPIAAGKPWILIGLVFVTSYIVAFIDQIAVIFLMWPVIYSMFKECGLEKGNRLVSAMVVGVIYMALLSFASDGIKSGAFYFITAVSSFAQNPAFGIEPMNVGAYMGMAIVVSLASILVYLFVMRFILRIDASPLKSFDVELLKANPLPPMSWQQKVTIAQFIFLAVYMLLPSFLPIDNTIGMFMNKSKMGFAMLLWFTSYIINYKGTPYTTLAIQHANAAWGVFYLIAVAMLFGNALTAPSTNFSVVIESLLRDFFTGFSYIQIIIVAVLLAIAITNFTNSVVTGLIFAPILIPLCNGLGYPAMPVLAAFFYIVLIALCTPAGSPYAAILFGNQEWIDTGTAVKYGILVSLISVICVLVVGVPLALVLF